MEYMEFDVDVSDMENLPGQPSDLEDSYKVLSYDEIQKRQEDDIKTVSALLRVSWAEATILLLFWNWDVQIVSDRWNANANRVREELGLTIVHAAESNLLHINRTCRKCRQRVPVNVAFDAYCCHKFCYDCWRDIIGTSLETPRLMLRCPVLSCNAALDQDTIIMAASEADRKIYSEILVRSYLAENRGKWCPTLGCNHGVLLRSGHHISKFTCNCLFTICYRCLKEAHQPVSCATFESWGIESRKQSHNWQVAYTRNCPNCNHSLEVKTQHKHVECTVCNFHFCRVCLCPWLEHGLWESDHYTHICTEEKMTEFAEDEKNRENVTREMANYQKYLAQWKSIDSDVRRDLMELRRMQDDELKVLAEKQGVVPLGVAFVKEARLQVAECKRFLKWYDVYDYYYFAAFQENRKHLYDDLTGKGVYVMEQLVTCGAELRKFIGTDAPTQQFKEFRNRVIFKTRVARNYFDNMDIVIQNGYQDMETIRQMIFSREGIERKPATDVGTSSGPTESTGESSEWSCPHCSTPNDNTTAICVMCLH